MTDIDCSMIFGWQTKMYRQQENLTGSSILRTKTDPQLYIMENFYDKCDLGFSMTYYFHTSTWPRFIFIMKRFVRRHHILLIKSSVFFVLKLEFFIITIKQTCILLVTYFFEDKKIRELWSLYVGLVPAKNIGSLREQAVNFLK